MDKIKTVSRYMQGLMIFLFVLQPIITALLCIYTDTKIGHSLWLTWIVQPQFYVVNAKTRILAFFVMMIETSVIMYGLYQIIKLFGAYKRGQVFMLENAIRIKKFGYAVFWLVFVNSIVSRSLMSLVLTFQNRSIHQKMALMFGIGSTEIYLLIFGFFVIIVAWVMQEAYKLHEDQSLTV